MIQKKLLFFIICFFCSELLPVIEKKIWTVIGAGPAGIAVIGVLLDLGVDPTNIYWIDPEFNVGRLGQYYQSIPGNAKTQMYLDFLNACRTFGQVTSKSLDLLRLCETQKEYPLHIIVEPLRDITIYLRTKVRSRQNSFVSLSFNNDEWTIGLDNGEYITAYYVVLATGAHPRVLNYQCKEVIPLDCALNKSFLESHIKVSDTVAVIGSAHSAILLLKFLSEIPVGQIINFYKKPIIYAVDHGSYIENQNAGLKGVTAEWARTVLTQNPPPNLIRLAISQENLMLWLPTCTKIIYAVGFERNELPLINNIEQICEYDEKSGVIGTRLFGIGIAFPEKYTYPDNNAEYRVGLKFFMEYAQRVIPEWMKREGHHLSNFEEMFEINLF